MSAHRSGSGQRLTAKHVLIPSVYRGELIPTPNPPAPRPRRASCSYHSLRAAEPGHGGGGLVPARGSQHRGDGRPAPRPPIPAAAPARSAVPIAAASARSATTGRPSTSALICDSAGKPAAAPGHAQLVDGRSRRLQAGERAVHREGDPLEHGVGQRRPVVAQREADERAAQVGVVALAVAEIGQEDRRQLTRVGAGAAHAPAQPIGVGGKGGVTAVAEPAHGPVDRGAARVDAELGREAVRHDVAVVGDADVGERLGHGRVEARRRPGHLAHGARVDDAGAEGDALAVGRTDHDRDPGAKAGLGRGRRRQLRGGLPARERLREELRVDVEPGQEVVRPPPRAQVEEHRRVGVRLVGRDPPGQPPQHDVARLQEPPRRGVDIAAGGGAARAASARCGTPRRRGRCVRGSPRRRSRRASRRASAPRPVVAVDHARPDGAAVRPDRRHRRALAGEADPGHPLRRAAGDGAERRERRDGVLGPLRPRPARPSPAAARAWGRAGGPRRPPRRPGRWPTARAPDVPTSTATSSGAAGAQPRTSWCARTLSPSRMSSAPFSAPVP